MKRAVVAVVVGYVLWTAVWLGGGATLGAVYAEEFDGFHAGGSLTATTPLAISLALSVVCSSLAGVVTATIAKARARGAVTVVALLLLATGIGVQASVWERMPLWYHLTFLALLVPVCVIAGRAAGRR